MLNAEYIGLMPRYTSTIYPVKKVVSLTTEQAQRIRDYRFEERIESENEAIRRLIEAGLGKAKATVPARSGSLGSARKLRGDKSAPKRQ